MKNLFFILVVFTLSTHCYCQKQKEAIFHKYLAKGDNEREGEKKNFSKAKEYYESGRSFATLNNLGKKLIAEAQTKIDEVEVLIRKYNAPSVSSTLLAKIIDQKPSTKAKKVHDTVSIGRTQKPQLKNSITIPSDYYFKEELNVNTLKNDIVQMLKKQVNPNDTIALNQQNREVSSVIESLYGINCKEYDKKVYDSISRYTDKPFATENEFFLCMQASAYYLWSLRDDNLNASAKKMDELVNVIEKTLKVISKNKIYHSAKIYGSYAHIENFLAIHYGEYADSKKEKYIHSLQAVNLGLKSVKLNPTNTYFLRMLFISVQNLESVDDQYISPELKAEFMKLTFEIADYCNANGSDKLLAMGCDVDCTADQVWQLLQQKKSTEAIALVNKKIAAIEALKVIPKKTSFPYAKPIYQVKLYNKLADIYQFELKDTDNFKKTAKAAQQQFITSLGMEIKSQRMLDRLKDNFEATANDVIFSFNDEPNSFFENTIKAIEEGKNDYFSSIPIALMHIHSSSNLAEKLLERQTRNDTLQATSCLDKGIRMIEKTQILKNYNRFTEDYAIYARMYRNTIEIYVNNKNYFQARQYYNAMWDNLTPIHNKYPFDYYSNVHLIQIANIYGSYLFNLKKYNDAVKPLEFASYEGIKNATTLLTKIYENKNSELYNAKKATEFSQRSNYQTKDLRKFSIPCNLFVSGNFNVYLYDKAKGHPYKGIEDQVEWLRVARGGKIDMEIRESFIKLQDLAWKNGVSYKELCAYALDAANKEKVLEKFKSQKDQIAAASGFEEKQVFYDALALQYDNEIKLEQKEDSKKIIIDDAIATYKIYADLLLKNNNTYKAKTIYGKIITLDNDNDTVKDELVLLDYTEKSGNPNFLLQENNNDKLKRYLRYSLKDKNTETATKLKDKIINNHPDVETLDDVSETYYAETDDDHFEELFLKNKDFIKKYRDYYIESKYYNQDDNAASIHYYLNLLKLDVAYLSSNPADKEKAKIVIAEHYNSLGWYKMLNKEFEGVMDYFTTSIAFDKTSNYPMSNIPHVYLLTNNFEKAKALYIEYKDRPFDPKSENKTFRDAFLNDFLAFEKAGIKNSHFKELRELLENKS